MSTEFENKSFVMSYSCGKDSTLALHKTLALGGVPTALLVMFNSGDGRSFFHGADGALLERYSAALQIPLLCVPSCGEDYHLAMEEALCKAKKAGAEFACFGDIDIEGHRIWGEERCRNAGLSALYPLWHANREENAREVINLGYKCVIKSVDNTKLPKSMLGKILDEALLEEMAQCGIDVCGENGEYHTLVVDGPIFRSPIQYTAGKILDFGEHSLIEIE